MGDKALTLGSLFSGSGGFEVGGILAGIEPVFNSDIEPFPVLVTNTRLPQVKHYGDVSQIKGWELPPVDIITGGFPCQSVSIAGRREGVKHKDHGDEKTTRSGLFYEAARIIKEMREATNGKYPRYFVAENVMGLFSSGGGEDFNSVLREICSVKGVDLSAVKPEKWTNDGEIMAEGFSVAWRVFDSAGWGVPQRRKRVYIVADFDGESAPEILFESEGQSGYSAEGFRAWQRAAGGIKEGTGETGGWPDTVKYCLNPQGSSGIMITEETTGTLMAQDHGNHPAVLQSAGFSTEHSARSRSIGYEEEKSPTLRAGVVPAAMLFDNHPQDCRYDGPLEESPTVTARYGTGGNNQPLVAGPEPVTEGLRPERDGGGKGSNLQEEKSAAPGACRGQMPPLFAKPQGFDRYNGKVTGDITHTLDTGGGNTVPMVFEPEQKSYGIAKEAYASGEKAAFNFAVNEEVSPTIQASGPGAVAKPEVRAFGISSKSSYAMQSRNPKAGFYEAETSRTLDQSGGNAVTSNQGGICVVAPDPVWSLQGSMIGRADKNGPQGDGINEDVSFTLNTVDRHAVAAPADDEHATFCATTGSYMTVDRERTPPLMARDYKDPQVINDTEKPEEREKEDPVYIVRRLTPVECARLQGFPDWWCSDLAIPDPTDEELAFWADVWETWRGLTNPDGKPKTEKQLRKWLADPCTDAAMYKLWGNGISLPIVYFVLSGIVWAAGKDKKCST